MYKVTNKLEQSVRFGKILFGPKETRVLKDKPYSDKFIVEKVEEKEKKTKTIKSGGQK